jgi:hypothetical protein
MLTDSSVNEERRLDTLWLRGAGGNNKIRGKSGSEYSTMIMVYDPDQLVDRKGHGNCPALPLLFKEDV